MTHAVNVALQLFVGVQGDMLDEIIITLHLVKEMIPSIFRVFRCL